MNDENLIWRLGAWWGFNSQYFKKLVTDLKNSDEENLLITG